MPASTLPHLSPPSRLGIAGDLIFSGQTPAEHLLNALLVYEQIVVPIDFRVLPRLLSDFSGRQLKRLIDAGCIWFCPEVTAHLALRREPAEFSRSSFLSSLFTSVLRQDDLDSGVIDAIDGSLLCGDYGDYSSWRRLHDIAVDEFDRVARREGYKHLRPPDTLLTSRNQYEAGLRMGLARMNDLIVAGVPEMQFDKELPVLLEICFPGKQRPQAVSASAIESDALDAVENLHGIGGLPILAPRASDFETDVDRLIDIVLSDEAAELRAWLSQHWMPGLDVRYAYIATERKLPSKKAWGGWLKFGAVTGVSTVIGSLIADPLTGFAAGTAIGALDQQFGQKSIERLADNYHPSQWLSYVGTLAHTGLANR
jgi:hypothetical protein